MNPNMCEWWPCDLPADVKIDGFGFCQFHAERIRDHMRGALITQTASDLVMSKFARDDITEANN